MASLKGWTPIYSPGMQDKIQKQILDAIFVVLRPIAKILLRYGIGFREFAEVAKSAFVDVASSEYGLRGRPTNISRVAVMTGLTRKEVRRLRDELEHGDKAIAHKYTPLSRVLHKWHSESEFLDLEGRPAILPFAGESVSFSSLVKKFGGDVPPGAMRTELKRVSAIEEVGDNSLRLIKRGVLPNIEHDNLCLSLVHGAYALLSNISHNTNPDRTDGPWPQMTAFTGDIRKSDLPRLRRICRDRARETVEALDDAFMAYEYRSEDDSPQVEKVPVAVGVFYFEESDKSSINLWEEK